MTIRKCKHCGKAIKHGGLGWYHVPDYRFVCEIKPRPDQLKYAEPIEGETEGEGQCKTQRSNRVPPRQDRS